jgi:hypothetical protein
MESAKHPTTMKRVSMMVETVVKNPAQTIHLTEQGVNAVGAMGVQPIPFASTLLMRKGKITQSRKVKDFFFQTSLVTHFWSLSIKL